MKSFQGPVKFVIGCWTCLGTTWVNTKEKMTLKYVIWGPFNTNGRAYVITKRNTSLHLDLFKLLLLTFDFKIWIDNLLTCKCKVDDTIPKPIQHQKVSVKLDVPTIGPHTLLISYQGLHTHHAIKNTHLQPMYKKFFLLSKAWNTFRCSPNPVSIHQKATWNLLQGFSS